MGYQTANPSTAQNGFFSEIQSIVIDTTREVAPIWAKRALKIQSEDQLSDPTFNPAVAANRLPDGLQTTAGDRKKVGVTDAVKSSDTTQNAVGAKASFINFGTEIDGLSIALTVVGGLAVWFLLGKKGLKVK